MGRFTAGAVVPAAVNTVPVKMLKSRVRLQRPSPVPIQVPGSWRTSDATSDHRGYGAAWQAARLQWLRKHPLCVYCEREGIIRSGNTVDHIIPHRGNQDLFWDRSNWQTLCATHHNRDKQREENVGSELP